MLETLMKVALVGYVTYAVLGAPLVESVRLPRGHRVAR